VLVRVPLDHITPYPLPRRSVGSIDPVLVVPWKWPMPTPPSKLNANRRFHSESSGAAGSASPAGASIATL
jgi:hypothetical protein